MKKIILTYLFVMIFFLTGCAKDTVSENLSLSRAEEPEYDEKYITVGFIQTGKESDWRDANTNDFLNTFSEENGYNLIYIDGNSDSGRQVKAMQDLIHQGVDYIVVDPIVEDGWDEALQEAKEKNIPVIISDRQVAADPSLYTCWVGSDFYTEGVNAAKWLEEYLKEQGRLDEEIKIVILEGTEGASAAIGRTNGLNEEIKKHPNWKIVAEECGNFTQGEGKTVMEEILKEQSDFDVLISENDNMMFGAMLTMQQKGISYGVDGKVITISFDALHQAFEKMISGELMVSVECNPLIASAVDSVIKDLENHKTVDEIHYIEESVFSFENAGEYIDDRQY